MSTCHNAPDPPRPVIPSEVEGRLELPEPAECGRFVRPFIWELLETPPALLVALLPFLTRPPSFVPSVSIGDKGTSKLPNGWTALEEFGVEVAGDPGIAGESLPRVGSGKVKVGVHCLPSTGR